MPIELMPWPWGKNCPVIIRDDDVSFFTSKKMLSDLYSHAWEKGYKVDFGVIPFISGNATARPSMRRNPRLAQFSFEPCIPAHVRGTKCNCDVRQNEELITFLSALRREGKADLSLHGYSHDLRDFSTNDFKTIETLLNSAIENFISAFDFHPKVFVFPYYECSKEAFSIASKLIPYLFLDRPISLIGRGLRRIGILKNMTKAGNDSIIMFPNNRISVFSPIFCGVGPAKAYENSRKIFANKLRKNDAFWIVHHFWEFYFDWQGDLSQKEFLENFNKMLDYMSRFEVWKCSTADLADWIVSLGQLAVERRSAKEVTLKSNKSITGLSVRMEGTLQENETRDLIKPLTDNTYVLPHLPANKKIRIRCS